MQSLPELCIAKIISLTTPREACRLATVSRIWRSAADYDVVWQRFLPYYYKDILSQVVNPLEYSSLKELFFRLCESVLIEDGNKLFSLNRSNGKISFILSPTDLNFIEEEGHETIWERIPTSELSWEKWDELEIIGEQPPSFRFKELALLRYSTWIDFDGTVIKKMLTPNTDYTIRLIFRTTYNAFNLRPPLNASVVQARFICNWMVSLESDMVHIRDNGWMELEIGRFSSSCGEDEGFVEHEHFEGLGIWVQEVNPTARSGLLVEGVECLPLN